MTVARYSPQQLAYFAHKLTLQAASDSMHRMAGALFDAQVDLNPHQVDAALFATSNPLSKGVNLQDMSSFYWAYPAPRAKQHALRVESEWKGGSFRFPPLAPNLSQQHLSVEKLPAMSDDVGLKRTLLEVAARRAARRFERTFAGARA